MSRTHRRQARARKCLYKPSILVDQKSSFLQGFITVWNPGAGWLLIGLGGLCDFVVVGSNIIAFQSDSSGFISLLGYMQVVYAFLFDIFVFKSTLSALQVGSALLICATTLTMAVYKAKTQIK